MLHDGQVVAVAKKIKNYNNNKNNDVHFFAVFMATQNQHKNANQRNANEQKCNQQKYKPTKQLANQTTSQPTNQIT